MQILYDIFRDMYYGRQQPEPDYPQVICHQETGSSPDMLWIGCSDCREDHALITGLRREKIITHRNICNLIKSGDSSMSSVIQYAVEVLAIEKIVVCGHSHCSGLISVLELLNQPKPMDNPIENWLEDVIRLADSNWEELKQITNQEARLQRLAEINVLAQIEKLRRNPYIRNNPELTLIPCIVDTMDKRIRSLSSRIIHREYQF